ncbi:50S ribosomal protein L11 methyltransferase [uncultured Oxalicibacterium sp.]|uniref:50S ribosomal protein L11 methyltransferase n=1 Tax=uncultured Oxalicibacterium sp. TaxID=1168540 RepID=UPI0025F35D5B|nr:50S ribosomal protein L11 methyltransferase [uncultured Oxalicibacterium sp.]
MSWTEIVIEVARSHAEPLSDVLMENGALSVSVEDADLGTDAEQPLFGEPGMEPTETAWERSRVVALTPKDLDHATLIADAAQAVGLPTDDLQYTLRDVAEQDWVRLTQSQFDPIHIGKNIWVVPSWHEAPDPFALILELDPGLAFGTGSHPTTRLCMEWLEAHPPVGLSVLDYGCGSGILAMVAKKLGAHDVIGIDIDPQAIEAARDNTLRNQCEVSYYVPDDFAESGHEHAFDVVVANILANPLKVMAPMLSARVKPGGRLVLSGILATQVEELTAIYRPFIELSVWQELDGWVALAGSLPASHT